MSNKFFNLLAWIPAIWACSCLLVIMLAAIQLGHLPVYGTDPDPTALGYERLSFASFILSLAAICVVFVFPVLLLVFYALGDRSYKTSFPSVVAYLSGIAFFFCLKYVFPM